MVLVDAHLHLTAYPDADEVVAIARRARRLALVSCTTSYTEVEGALRLRAQNPGAVRCFLGVHPSDATEVMPSEVLRDDFPICDGIGEIGLDPKYSDASEGSMQMKVFVDQLMTAERLGKPVQVHTRGSVKECLDVLSSYRLDSVLLHWFEGEEEMQRVISKGYFISLGPAVLYSKRLQRIARKGQPDRLLTESDGPVRFGVLGGVEGPELIASVVFKLGELLGVGFQELERTIEASACNFLRVAKLLET
jgi:TatD DNase family protein